MFYNNYFYQSCNLTGHRGIAYLRCTSLPHFTLPCLTLLSTLFVSSQLMPVVLYRQVRDGRQLEVYKAPLQQLDVRQLQRLGVAGAARAGLQRESGVTVAAD
jgi:hypothetical protein